MRLFIAALLATASIGCASSLRDQVTRTYREAPESIGIAVVVLGPNEAVDEHATGVAGPDGRVFTVDTPLRIASNTKTYVAATALRLYERGQIDLDATLAASGDPSYTKALSDLGYDVNAITIRHLLMHASGMPDHADDAYVAAVLQEPKRVWTRIEQVTLLADRGPPLGDPGTVYRYSDTGYVILGDILERASGRSLAELVRTELRLDRFTSTWWERQEQAPTGAKNRARQYLEGAPVSDIDPSVDLFGGGGLLASTRDLALFMQALFHGAIFDDPATLALMRTAPAHPSPDRYRIGLQPKSLANGGSPGTEVLGHSGFWGTVVWYVPELDVVIAGAILDGAGWPSLIKLLEQIVAEKLEAQRVSK